MSKRMEWEITEVLAGGEGLDGIEQLIHIHGPQLGEHERLILASEVEKLMKRLARYGTHRAECAMNAAPPRRGSCDCGWAEVSNER
jgi:hypothetical protein